MFCRCRATVCSLMTSADAISRLLRPAATSRSTSSSRGVSPWLSTGPRPMSASTRARSGARPEPREHLPGRLELEQRRVVIAQGARTPARAARACAPPRTAPRAPATSPTRGAATTSAAPASPVASSTAPRDSAASAPIIPLCQRSAISCSSAQAPRAASDVAHRQHDLDVGGQQPGAPGGLGRLAQQPADRRGRRRAIPLRQPQQRQARLRLVAAAARLAVRLLGRAELALQALDLPLPVARLGGR